MILGNLVLEERKSTSQGGTCLPERDCQTTLQDETAAQTMMGQWWVEPCIEVSCLDGHILGLYLYFNLTSEP